MSKSFEAAADARVQTERAGLEDDPADEVGVDAADGVDGAACYRDLLDLRNESLRLHGLDMRTEMFRGDTVAAIRERLLTSDEQTLLVIGLTSPERCNDLVDELRVLLRSQPPAAVLFVSGRDEQTAEAAPKAYAFAL